MNNDVARVIGWPTVGPKRIIGRRVVNAPAVDNYAVDDLLAWLNENLFHVWVEVYGDPAALPEAWDVYVNYRHVIEYGVEEDRHFTACAPTLLEAFERIVLHADITTEVAS